MVAADRVRDEMVHEQDVSGNPEERDAILLIDRRGTWSVIPSDHSSLNQRAMVWCPPGR